MKQKTLLFTFSAAMAFIVLSSNDNGPVQAGTGNRTGSASSTATCGGGGCHANNNAATTAQVMITDTASTTAITSYTPGKKYYLRVVGGSATLAKYGFQASTVKNVSPFNVQAGTMAVGGSSTANTAIRTSGSLQIFEHTQPLSATVIAGAQVYGANCYWTAPAAGTGAVKVFATINGVNGDGTTSGDAPNAATPVTINEASSSVENTTSNINFKVFPNPAVNNITITADGISTGICTVNVFDLRGKLIATQNAEASNGTLNTTINSSKWAAGIHLIQIQKEGQQKLIPVVKQ